MRGMTHSRITSRLLDIASGLAFLGVICTLGAGLLGMACPDVIQAEVEEAEQRLELEDLDDLEMIVSCEVSLHSSDASCELLCLHHDCPLLTHSWRWCSRGPPAA